MFSYYILKIMNNLKKMNNLKRNLTKLSSRAGHSNPIHDVILDFVGLNPNKITPKMLTDLKNGIKQTDNIHTNGILDQIDNFINEKEMNNLKRNLSKYSDNASIIEFLNRNKNTVTLENLQKLTASLKEKKINKNIKSILQQIDKIYTKKMTKDSLNDKGSYKLNKMINGSIRRVINNPSENVKRGFFKATKEELEKKVFALKGKIDVQIFNNLKNRLNTLKNEEMKKFKNEVTKLEKNAQARNATKNEGKGTPNEELNTVPIPTNNGSGNELGNNSIQAGEAQTGEASNKKAESEKAGQKNNTTGRGGRSWLNTFTGAGSAARKFVGKGVGKGLAAVEAAALLGYTGYKKNKGFVNSTKYPIPYNLKNIKNSRRISNRLKIKFSGNEADKHFQIAKGLFAIRHPLLKENYIGEVLKMNDEQLAILSGIKEINKTNYEKRMDITKLLGLQLAVNKFYETGSYLINPKKKENYKIYYSNKVDNKNIYKVLHFYITKGIEGLDQKYTTLDFTIFSSSSIQSLDDVVRYIIAMTREFYIYRYPQKGEEKTIEQLNKLIEYLFSEEEQKKKIKYLDTYLKNLKVEMDRFKARNKKVLNTEIQTMQRYFNATSHSKAIKNIIEVFKQANSKKNLRT